MYIDAPLTLNLVDGYLSLLKDPATALHGATKQYVDARPAIATIADTAPSSPSNGQLWFESSTGSLFIYYNDGDSSQWVQVNGTSG